MKQYWPEVFWALIFSASTIAWLAFERMVGLHAEHIAHHPTFTNMFALVAIIVFVLAFRARRLRPDSRPGWWPAFAFGVRLSLVIALLSPVVQWLVHTVVTPNFFANAIDYTVSSGSASEQEAREFFNLGSYMVMGAASAMIMGVFTSLIVAIFQKKPEVQA